MTRLIPLLLLAAAAANTINVKLPKGQILKVEVATSPEDLGRGLMGRKSIPPDSGMLFVYAGDMRTRYLLWGYPSPMDILYLDENKVLINLIENATPCRTVECGNDSVWMHRFALQLPAGSVKRFNLHGGDVLSFDLPGNSRKTSGK